MPFPCAVRNEALRLLRLLGNEHRLMIGCLLIFHGELSAGQLAKKLNLRQSALSQHLSRMRHDDVLTFRRDARMIYYRIKCQNMAKLIYNINIMYLSEGRLIVSHK
ncbi:ArsR/SmtB family transcription factor [Methylobacterium komagatae]